MSVLSYQTLLALCETEDLIRPYYGRTVVGGRTYGLSACGYDVRVAEGWSLLPGEFRLASTIERFRMPNNIVGIVHDKSSWARQGLAVQNTVIEPGWRGYLTLELSNHGHHTLQINSGDPICQILFHTLDQETHKPYSGKYQDQEAGPQPARFDK